ELARRNLELHSEFAEAFAQGFVRGHAATDCELLQAGLLKRAPGARRERLDDRALVGGREVSPQPLRLVFAELADAIQERRFEACDREAQPAQPRTGPKRERLRTPVAREPLERRPAGIPESEQARAFVKCLSGGVVERLAEHVVIGTPVPDVRN